MAEIGEKIEKVLPPPPPTTIPSLRISIELGPFTIKIIIIINGLFPLRNATFFCRIHHSPIILALRAGVKRKKKQYLFTLNRKWSRSSSLLKVQPSFIFFKISSKLGCFKTSIPCVSRQHKFMSPLPAPTPLLSSLQSVPCRRDENRLIF